MDIKAPFKSDALNFACRVLAIITVPVWGPLFFVFLLVAWAVLATVLGIVALIDSSYRFIRYGEFNSEYSKF